jgi:hypothetical protein
MHSPELLRIEAAECRRGAVGKSVRVERTLLALAERLESEATSLEDLIQGRGYAGSPHNKSQKVMGVLTRPYSHGIIGQR